MLIGKVYLRYASKKDSGYIMPGGPPTQDLKYLRVLYYSPIL